MRDFLNRLLADRTGTSAAEYGFIAALIAAALAGVIGTLGNEVSDHYGEVETLYADAARNAG